MSNARRSVWSLACLGALTGFMVDQTGTYSSAFYLTAAILVFGWLTFLLFGTGKQILD